MCRLSTSAMAPRSYIKPESDLPSTDSEGMSDNNSGESKGKGGHRRVSLDKGSDEYKKRRERNNLAVKKSRCKTKQKTQETLERVNLLREENALLESKIQLLTKELSFLKDLFLAHAGSAHGNQLKDLDLSTLLANDGPSPVAAVSHNDKNKAAGRDHQYAGHGIKMEV